MSAVKYTPMEIAAAKELCRAHALVCYVNAEDVWKGYSEDFLRDARAALQEAGVPMLLEALRELGDWFGLTKPPLDQWEDLAEEFHKATGFLRPGKSMPAAAGWTEEQEEERSRVWGEWVDKRRDEMIGRLKAAIAAASPSLNNVEGEQS